MASQPEDSGVSYRAELENALRAQGLVPPNRPPDRLKTEFDEQLYVIGQLMGKLEAQGVDKALVTRLLNVRFDVGALEPPPQPTQAALLASRDVEETIYRIQQALCSAQLLAPPHASAKLLARDRKLYEQREADDEKRGQFVKCWAQARSANQEGTAIEH